jgi:superfamily II DNA helicase RecQ
MLTSIFPKITFLAMTATATLQMKKDITTSLGLINPKHIEIISPDHRNIFFSSLPRPDRGGDKLQVDPSTYFNSSDCRIKSKTVRFPSDNSLGQLASYWRMFFVCKQYDGAFAI